MPRQPRVDQGGLVYHALNRANARLQIFGNEGDFAAFERVLSEAVSRFEMRLLAYCVLPNHFHLVLWPHHDGDLAKFMRWLSVTHTQRWHKYRQTAGSGHIYQGRYKSFPVECDDHFYTVCRYVERNAQSAGLVTKAEQWRWGSLWWTVHAQNQGPKIGPWPIERPADWVARVNAPMNPREEEGLRRSLAHSESFGTAQWRGIATRNPSSGA